MTEPASGGAVSDRPRVVVLRDEHLGEDQGREDVLDVLERGWSGARSYDLEARLRGSDVPVELFSWSG